MPLSRNDRYDPLPETAPGLPGTDLGSPVPSSQPQPPNTGGLAGLLSAFVSPFNSATYAAANMLPLYTSNGGIPQAGTGAGSTGTSEAVMEWAANRLRANEENPWIYLGQKTGYHVSASGEEHEYDKQKRKRLAALMTAFEGWDNAKKYEMYRLILTAGLDGNAPTALEDVDDEVSGATLTEVTDAYFNLLGVSAAYLARGRLMTPEEVLAENIAARLSSAGVQWDGELSDFDKGLGKSAAVQQAIENGDASPTLKPYTLTTTTRTVDIMDPMDAKALTRAMLQQELGRDPTQAEYEDFISAIQAAERQNPTTSTTTARFGVNDATDQYYQKNTNTVTHSGIGPEGIAQLAYERAQRQPGWAEWQAMGTYAPALFAALGAPIEGV